MSRRRLLVLFLPVLLILVTAGVFYALLHTAPGARWVWQRAVGLAPGELRAAAVSGDLQSGLRLDRVSYRDEAVDVRVDTVELRLDFDLLPPALAVHSAEFGALEVRPLAADEQTSARPEDVLTALALPLPLEFKHVRGERISWFGPDGEAGLELQGLRMAASWYKRLVLQSIDTAVVAPAMRWQGGGELGLQAPFTLRLDVRGTVGPVAEVGLQETIALTLRLDGDLGALRLDAQVDEPNALLTGTLEGLLDSPAWDLQLSADRLPWPLGLAEPRWLAEQLTASSYGWVDDFGLEVDGSFGGSALQGLEGLRARLVGAGDSGGLRIELLEAAAEALALDGTGLLDWDTGFGAELAVNVDRFDPAPWMEAWGEAEPVRGRLQLGWSGGRLDFAATDLVAPGTFANLAGSGAFDPDSGAVEAAIDWRELAWPPGAAAPDILSQDGTGQLAGRLDEWSVAADLGLEARDLPAGRLQVRGTGDRQGMALKVPRGEVLDGSLAGEFAVRWSPDLSWSAAADFADLQTGPLAPGWPGRISGEATLRGRADPVELEVDLRRLAGTLRDQPISADGSLLYRENRLRARNLQIRFGSSEISLDGDPNGRDGLAFSTRIPSLADLVDGAAGSLAGAGKVSLDPAGPSLTLDLEGQGLVFPGYSIETLRVATAPGEEPALRAEVGGMAAGENRIDTLTLVTGSRRPLERVDAEATMADSRLELGLSGGVVDWSAPLAGGWRGTLARLRLDREAVGWIELEEPAGLAVDSDAVTLAPACFQGSRKGRLCLESSWRLQGERMIEATLEEVSPNLAMALAGSDLTFTQLLTGKVSWRQAGAAQPEAVVDVSISPGDIRAEGDDQPIIATGSGKFGFEIADGRLFAGNLDIPVPGAGGIDTDFSAPDLSAGLASAVQGRIRLDLRDIGPVLELISSVEGSSGPVAADLRFSGTLGDPRLTGHVSLVRGRISHFASGLLLEDLTVAGAVYEYDQTELTGTFRAGEGRGSIRAVVNFSDLLAPEMLLEIAGENLTLVDVPDLNVRADPDLRLIWREGTLGVAGRVRVPVARLSPRYLPTSGVAESPDVVIVAGVDPYARPQQATPSNWVIRGELELELGEDVRLQLEKAQARLTGTAAFRWDGPLLPTATGGFDVTGEIYAYGQLLRVTEGRVNFANRSADNPFLTIRAEREIFGNSQVRRAGVLVTGTVRRPVVETYTDPMTTRERALALLVTGSDFNYEQGVGAVEVGMYVAPKLFISYGVGLFDDQNVISARYDLGKGFGVKATSGQRETGVDISYTIER